MNHLILPLVVVLGLGLGTAGSAASSARSFAPLWEAPLQEVPAQEALRSENAEDADAPVADFANAASADRAEGDAAYEELDDADTSYEEYIAEQSVTKYFLVVGTFRSFTSAQAAAARLVDRTGLQFERGELEVVDGQPSYSRQACELSGWDYPCYVPRGRFDDGSYLSVEPTDEYQGMKPGSFVVVAASGSREDVLAEQRELAARGVSGTVSSSTVWMGCIH